MEKTINTSGNGAHVGCLQPSFTIHACCHSDGFASVNAATDESCYIYTNGSQYYMHIPQCSSSDWHWVQTCVYDQRNQGGCILDFKEAPQGMHCDYMDTYEGRQVRAAKKLADNLKKIMDDEGIPRYVTVSRTAAVTCHHQYSMIQNFREAARIGLPAASMDYFRRSNMV